MQIEDRRAFRRYRHQEPVRYEIPGQLLNGGSLSRDISEGGLQIRLTEFIPLHAQVILQIQLTNGQMIDSMGQVAWIRKVPFMDHFHAGLKFSDPQVLPIVQKEIRLFVNLYQPQFENI